MTTPLDRYLFARLAEQEVRHNMKVTDRDYQTIRLVTWGSMMLVEHGPNRKAYDGDGLSAQRRRWDAFWHGTQGRTELRTYLFDEYTDDHIDTALRKIQREAAGNAANVS